MKKTMLTLAMGILIMTAAQAQGQHRGHLDKHPKMHHNDSFYKHEARLDHFIQKIEEKAPLTAAEKEGLKTIMTDFHTQMKSMDKGDRDAFKTAVEARDQKVKALLSDKAYIAYLETRLEMHKPRHGKHGKQGDRADHFINKLDEKASLTEDEKVKMKEIMTDFRTQVRENPENRKELADARDKKVKALLSAEKFKAYEELKAEMKAARKKHKSNH
ncbi:hypothetical protein GYB22_13120 [bacterium]|nr:hypothetical protein [bacterium]